MRFLIVFFLIASCTTPQKDNTYDPTHGTAITWYEGSIKSAFEKAKKEKKVVLLYWGAKWCPPCNDLKQSVFSKQKFAELTSGLVPVYLDGDAEYAQAWGEIFDATGYPTILIMDENRSEIMRMTESLTIEEFEEALSSVDSLRKSNETLMDEVITTGSGSDDLWRRFAYFSWQSSQNKDYSSPKWVEKRLRLIELMPEKLGVEKSLMQASLMYECSGKKTGCERVKELSRVWLDAIFSKRENILATRSTLIYGSKEILDWSGIKGLNGKWIEASDWLSSQPQLSVDTRLWAVYPRIQLLGDKVEKKRVIEAVHKADKEAITEFSRQATITGAAYLLRKIKEFDRAENLLKNELKHTKSPFYYYSALANVAKDRGDIKNAIEYIRKASESVEGRSTKVQWAVSRMTFEKEVDPNSFQVSLTSNLKTFYDHLFDSKSSFYGRSLRSVSRLEKTLSGQTLSTEIKKMLAGYKMRCNREKNLAKKRCEDHFARIKTSTH